MLVFRSIVNEGMAEAIVTVYVLGDHIGKLPAPAATPILDYATNTAYDVGDVVRPDGAQNRGRLYVCIVAGDSADTAAAESPPIWPAGDGEVVTESAAAPATWKEVGFDGDLTIKDNFLIGPASTIVVDGPIGALVLTGNSFTGGDRLNPSVAGLNLSTLAGPAFLGPNTFSSAVEPGEIPVRYEGDGTATSVLTLHPGGAGSGGRIGVNTVRPGASLDVFHGAGNTAPAFLMRDDQALHHDDRVILASSGYKRMIRHHTASFAWEEPGTVTLLEAARVGQEDSADLCKFRLPPDTVAFAEAKVVAKTGGSSAIYTAYNAFARDGDSAAVAKLSAATGQQLAIVDAPFPDWTGPGEPEILIDSDDLTVMVRVTAPLDSSFEVELRLTLTSTFATKPDIVTATLAGDIVITTTTPYGGRSLFSYGLDKTTVFLAGSGAAAFSEDDIIAEIGGVVSATEIVIPAALLPVGVAPFDALTGSGTRVMVRANGYETAWFSLDI